MKQTKRETGLTRRNFMKGGAGVVLAAGCLHALGRGATTLAA